MNFIRLSPLLVVATLSAGCTDRTSSDATRPGASPSVASAPAVTVPAARTGTTTELPVGAGPAEALPLVPGSFISGSSQLKDAVTATALAVQVGNYGNTSDGKLAVEVCEQKQCSHGEAPLSGSADNQYLEVAFDQPLAFAAGQSLTYRISKLEGGKPVAVWLYPASSGQKIAVNGKDELPRTPRLAIRH